MKRFFKPSLTGKMIQTKAELKYYLACDRIALGKKQKRPALFGDDIWKFQICMRKLDYYKNLQKFGGGYLRSITDLGTNVSPFDSAFPFPAM